MCHLVFLSAQFNFPVVFLGLQRAKLAVKVFHIGPQLVCKKYTFLRIIIFNKGLFKSSHTLQSYLLIKMNSEDKKFRKIKKIWIFCLTNDPQFFNFLIQEKLSTQLTFVWDVRLKRRQFGLQVALPCLGPSVFLGLHLLGCFLHDQLLQVRI